MLGHGNPVRMALSTSGGVYVLGYATRRTSVRAAASRTSDRRGKAGGVRGMTPDATAIAQLTAVPLEPTRLRPRANDAIRHGAELRRVTSLQYNEPSHEGLSSCGSGLA